MVHLFFGWFLGVAEAITNYYFAVVLAYSRVCLIQHIRPHSVIERLATPN